MTYPINAQNQRYQAYPGNYSGVTINVTNPSLSSNFPGCPMQSCNHVGYAHQRAQINSSTNSQVQDGYYAQPQVYQQVNYPPEYYINNYNQQSQSNIGMQYQNPQGQAVQLAPQPQVYQQVQVQPQVKQPQAQQSVYVYPAQASQGYAGTNGYANSVATSPYQVPDYNPYPAYDFEQEQNLASSKEVLAKLDKLIEIEQNQQKVKTKKQVVVLTDEYIMSLENFLNNPNKEIRRKGASEVINRLGEDKDRKTDPALNALLNKMLQDPDRGVRILAISAFSSGIAKGNDLSVQLLKYIEANPQMYPDDVEPVSMALLKMAADTETIYVDAPVNVKK